MAVIGAPRLWRYFGRKRRQRFSPRFISSIADDTARISGVRPKNARARARRVRLFASTERSRSVSSASLGLRVGKGRMETRRELGCVVVRPEMHEEEPRRLLEHVTVHRGHLDPVFTQRPHHWIHLA